MREWYTVAELVGLPGYPGTPQNVRKALASTPSRPRAHGKGREYHIKHLRRIAQDALIAQEHDLYSPLSTPLDNGETAQIALSPPVFCEKPANPAPNLPTVAHRTAIAHAPREIPLNGDLATWQRECRDARLTILILVDDYTRTLGSVNKAVERVVALAQRDELPAIQAAALPLANERGGTTRTITRPSLYRWLAARRLGVNALAPAAPVHEPQPWLSYLLARFQDPAKPSLAACLRALQADPPAGIPLPSLRTAQQVFKGLPQVVTQWGRMGSHARRAIRPFIRRTTTGYWPMDVVAVDGHLFKAYVAHPLSGKRFKPEITTYIDLTTRKIVSFSVWVAESQHAIWMAYRAMVTNPQVGIPAIQYSDNGAYRAEQHRTLLERIGTHQEHSLPGNPQANGVIERLNQSLWLPAAKALPLYAGKDMDKEAFKRRKAQADADGTGLVSFADCVAFCREQVDAYNDRPHAGLTRKSGVIGRRQSAPRSPNQAWAEAVEEGWQPTLLDHDDLHELLPSETRTCRRCEVSLPWGHYFHKDLEAANGFPVNVAYDPFDNARVWVSDSQGRLLAVAGLDANARDYMPVTEIEHGRQKRAEQRVKRNDKALARILAEEQPLIDAQVIDVSGLPDLVLPGPGDYAPDLGTPATLLTYAAPAALPALEPVTPLAEALPTLRPPRHWIDDLDNDAKRYEAFNLIKARQARGEAVDERETAFYAVFADSDYRQSADRMWDEWERQCAAAGI
jgi:putative transposase